MKKILLTFFIIFSFISQAGSQNISSQLINLFSRLGKVDSDENRLRINDSIKIIINDYASSDSVFEHSFTDLRFLGQITSPDKALKIINWNLVLSENENRYFCYFIKKNINGNKVFAVEGTNTDGPIRKDILYSQENWYGALYYDLSPVKINKEVCYILLGIDFGNNFTNRKLIDVVGFTTEGTPVFGKKWFDTGNDLIYRVVFEYDATGVMSLRFHSPRVIVFDHLAPLYHGDKLSYGAEFTLDSYSYRNGIWKFEKNVDYRNKD